MERVPMNAKLLSKILSRTKNARDMTIELIQGINEDLLSSYSLSDEERKELEDIRDELQEVVNHCDDMLGEPKLNLCLR